MIVKCENCQTRFKIPDEKVTEKGVKVRCTKCQHTFRVHRPPAEAADAAPKKDVDPFAQYEPGISTHVQVLAGVLIGTSGLPSERASDAAGDEPQPAARSRKATHLRIPPILSPAAATT